MPPLLKIKQLNVITINYTARASEKSQAAVAASSPLSNKSTSATSAV
jgi:hypothetical protein